LAQHLEDYGGKVKPDFGHPDTLEFDYGQE